MDEVRPDSALLFGANIPHEHVKSIIDSCSKRKLSPDHEEIGFSFVERGDKRILIYSLPEIGYPDYLENLSLVLHIFRMLSLETVAIINAVHYIKQDPPPIVLIIDHVNLTGINPLDYWMMPYEPEPFFLDIKNLYITDRLTEIPQVIHLSICPDCMNIAELESEKAGAVVYGCGFCPESIIAGYLGMRVLAVGITVPIQMPIRKLKDEFDKLFGM